MESIALRTPTRFCASYLLGTTMSDVMPSRKWRVLTFVLVFICVVSHRCVAGPYPPNGKPCTSKGHGFPLRNPFPRAASFRQPPTSMFRLDEINLTRITIPPEFRVHDPEAANATGVILQTHPWPPPCSTTRRGSNRSLVLSLDARPLRRARDRVV
jgi:hypothetical protein